MKNEMFNFAVKVEIKVEFFGNHIRLWHIENASSEMQVY